MAENKSSGFSSKSKETNHVRVRSMHSSPIVEGKPIEVMNIKYSSGRNAHEWRDITLEATADDVGNVTLSYMAFNRFDHPNKNQTRAYGTLKSGIYTEMGDRTPTLHNLDLSLAQSVSGRTFDVKEVLREHGFRWNGNERKWVR